MLRNLLILMVMMNGVAFFNTEYTNNVGTVLFTTSDTNRKHWNTDEIGVLKARLYFQNLLPPPLYVRALNENYVDMLFNYFKEAYSAIKRETDDPYMDRTMTTALSDSIGGYLKAWVLPGSKFAFYGGTISAHSVTTLCEFYDEIKRYLRTDGDGWHRPKSNLLGVSMKTPDFNLMTVDEGNIDPCDHFVFFEKTPEGLNVPIPHVSWDGASSKLFLPLKNHSIYAMNSPNSSSVLVKYYDTAKYCLQHRYPLMLENFDARFQSWLANEVLPHLGDDNVYLALGSVLTVMNKTRGIYDNVFMYEKNPKPFKKVHSFAFSKRMMIVTLIIAIEVVWCLLALIYTCYVKRKKNKVSQVYLFVEPRHRDKKDKSYNTQEAFGRKPFGIKESKTSIGGDSVQTDVVDTLFVRGTGLNPERKHITQKAFGRKPIGIKENDTWRGVEAGQIDVETLYMRGTCLNPDRKHSTNGQNTVTQSDGIVTSITSSASHPKIHSKKVSKTNPIHSDLSALYPNSTCNTIVPISSSKTNIDVVRSLSSRRLKYRTDEQTDKSDKHVKHFGTQKVEKTNDAVTETRKSKKEMNVQSSERELKALDPRRSSRSKSNQVPKSKGTKRVQVYVPSKEQSIDTAEFMKSGYFRHTVGIQNVSFAMNSSKNLNTDLSINHHMRHEESQCNEAAKTSIHSVNTENIQRPLKLLDRDGKSKNAEFITDPPINCELIKKETLIIKNPKFIEEKLYARSEKYSRHTVEPKRNKEISRIMHSPKDSKTYPVLHMLDKDSKYQTVKSSKVSTPKSLKKSEPLVEKVMPSYSSKAKIKRPAKADPETKTPRLSVQKEFKDIKYSKDPYWEITIDEPNKNVVVDIKGSIKMDSKNVKSRIPKLSVKAFEARTTEVETSPRAPRARSLIPQLKKKAADDLALKANAEKNKLNTSI